MKLINKLYIRKPYCFRDWTTNLAPFIGFTYKAKYEQNLSKVQNSRFKHYIAAFASIFSVHLTCLWLPLLFHWGTLCRSFYLLFHLHLANFKYAFFESDPLLFRYDYNNINSLHDIDWVLKLIPEIPNMLLCAGIIQSGKFKQFLLIFNHYALQYG